jgi:hypothetical protein
MKYQCELLPLAEDKSGATGRDSYTDLNWKNTVDWKGT